jgi:hypothetical protein
LRKFAFYDNALEQMKSILEDEIQFYNLQSEENEEAEVNKVNLEKIQDQLRSGDDRVILKPKLIPELQVRTTYY